jgi:transcriptional regulator with XRE-family HTH domain
MLGMVTQIHNRASNRPRHYLQEWRLAKGLTQEQLADRVGTAKGVVSRHENDKRKLKMDKLAQYAEALGIETEQLFRDPAAPSLDELIRDVPPELKRQIFTVVTAMLKTGTDG